jgi:hypothetical protein
MLREDRPGLQSRTVPPVGTPPRRISPGEAVFFGRCPDDGTRGVAALAHANMPQTDEGRKGGTDGRKESVNVGADTRDSGLISCLVLDAEGPRGRRH